MRRLAALSLLLFALPGFSQQRVEYRGFWVDTFNTALNNHNAVVAVVNNAKAAKANAIFAQVRRRADSFYQNTLEPLPQGVTFSPSTFDPLQDLINEAHANSIEVHAFVIIGAVSDNNPTTNRLTNPNHVFNKHGGYDSNTGTIVPGPNNWLTRTLLPDNTAITFQGHRFGGTFWIDLGHPDAAQYTHDVIMNIVRNYNIDGVHLDRIRYPEFSATGQTPANGTNIGYNTTSVDRFNTRFNQPVGTNPAPSNNDWKQWRRDQVTNFVRRLYLSAIAEKPQLKMSGAFIAFGGGPTSDASWASAEAYWRVYQDWRAWTEEGIVDMAIPMNYKREHTTTEAGMFNSWSEWLKNHQYNRAGLIGMGNYLNGIEGSLRQTRRSLDPSAAGNRAAGVMFYAMANPDALFITNPTTAQIAAGIQAGPNPFALPSPINTPKRGIAEFASGLTTGKSVNTLVQYETATPSIFADAATRPVFPWKSAPTKGHLMGFARRPLGSAIDTGVVTVMNVSDGTSRTAATDGNGFFGAVDLEPGRYHVKVALGSEAQYSCFAQVAAGEVTTADASNTHAPVLVTPDAITASTDPGSCSASVTVSQPALTHGCGTYTASFVRSDGATSLTSPFPKGTTTIDWKVPTADGPLTASQTVTVRDAEAPAINGLAADTAVLWPVTQKMVRVNLSYSVSDNCSGSITRSLSVTSNEPVSGNGNGDETTDWEIVDADTVRLRAERSGTGTGRIYTITLTATDASGNSSQKAVEVTVPHDRGN